MEALAREAARARVFHTLDALRGVAAITVMLGHYDLYLTPYRLGSAYLAVDLFFLMSGFVLARAYGRRFEEGLSAGRFLSMRLVRLYPLYAIGTLLTVVVAASGLIVGASMAWTWSSLLRALVPAIAMLPALPVPGVRSGLYPLDGPAWSLFYELIVNILLVLTWRFVSGRGAWVFIVAGLVGLVVATSLLPGLNGGSIWGEWGAALARVSFSFFLGVAIERLFERQSRAGRVFTLRCPPAILLIVSVVALSVDPGPTLRPLYDLVCVVVVFPPLVWLCLTNEPRAGVRMFATLGLISYPLYVVHVPASYVLTRGIQHAAGRDPLSLAPWVGLVMVAMLLPFSWMLARYVDVPARRRLARAVGLGTARVA